MNFKAIKKMVAIATLMGCSTFIQRAHAVMIGGDPTIYKPVDSASLKNFLATHANGVTPADMDGLTCGTVHPCTVIGSDQETVQAPPQTRSDPAATVVANADPTPASPAAQKSATFPCPTGYAVKKLFAQTGDATCQLDQTDVNTGNIVESTLNVDPQGNGYVYTSKIGDANSCGDDGCYFTYGLITQTVLDANKQPLSPVTYNNYFLGQLSDATTLAQVECQLGNAVTYVTAPGKGNASGYQIQVVIGNSDQNSTDKTYIPAGDSNLCLTTFLPSSANN